MCFILVRNILHLVKCLSRRKMYFILLPCTDVFKKYEETLGHVILEGNQLDNVYTFEFLGCRIQSDGARRQTLTTVYQSPKQHSTPSHTCGVTTDSQKIWKSDYIHLPCDAWTFSPSVKKLMNGFNSRGLSFITWEQTQRDSYKPRLWPSGSSG